MGGCLSCWGRRRKDDERQPLLHPEQTELPESTGDFEKVSECLGALSARKLPSETQLETILRNALNSRSLMDDALGGYGPLSERGRKVLLDVRELLEAVLHIGMEKNDDDVFQNLYYNYSKLDRHSAHIDLTVQSKVDQTDVEAVEQTLPTKAEVQSDTQTLIRSVKTLLSLFLTSSVFRILLSDLFLSTREMLADAAAHVGSIAKVVEEQAFSAEHGLRPDLSYNNEPNSVGDRADGILDSDIVDDHFEELKAGTQDRVKERFLVRWEELLSRAYQNPAYRASLVTILSLLDKYYKRGYSVASKVSETNLNGQSIPDIVDSQVALEPEVVSLLSQLKTVLERMAGHKSLDSLITNFHDTLELLASSPNQTEIRMWFEEAGRYIQRAMNEANWISSREAHIQAEHLYDATQDLFHKDENSEWVRSSRKVTADIDDFVVALKHDKPTQRLIHALEALLDNTRYLLQASLGLGANVEKQIGREIREDILGWLLPRLLRLIRSVPMPRIEFASPAVDAVIDSLVLHSASTSLLPDHIYLQVLEELRMDLSREATSRTQDGGGKSLTHFRTKLHLDGMRVAARGISYYVDVKGPAFLGWMDNGFLDMYVGKTHRTGHGLQLDLELDTDFDAEKRSLFRATGVKLDVPGLTFRVNQSHHWILNKLLLQPVAGPLVRRVISWILTNQVHQLLDALDKRMFNIYERASRINREESSPGLEDYWQATLEEFATTEEDDSSEEAVSDTGAITQSEMHASLTGVVYTTTTLEPEASEPATTAIAVGAGEQILPGKGGPVLQDETPQKVARDIAYQLEDSLEHGKHQIHEAEQDVVHSREQVAAAQARLVNTKEAERKHAGWQSSIFDI